MPHSPKSEAPVGLVMSLLAVVVIVVIGIGGLAYLVHQDQTKVERQCVVGCARLGGDVFHYSSVVGEFETCTCLIDGEILEAW